MLCHHGSHERDPVLKFLLDHILWKQCRNDLRAMGPSRRVRPYVFKQISPCCLNSPVDYGRCAPITSISLCTILLAKYSRYSISPVFNTGIEATTDTAENCTKHYTTTPRLLAWRSGLVRMCRSIRKTKKTVLRASLRTVNVFPPTLS